MERRMDRRERERSRAKDNHHHQQSDTHRVDLDSRTPLAWQRRDFNHQNQPSFNDRYPEGVPSSSSDRFSHRSARSADRHRHRQAPAGGQQTSRSTASKKTSTSSSGTTGVGLGAGTPRTGGGGSAAGSGGNRNSATHHPSRSSEETTTGGSASETETDAERGGQQSRPGTSGTLRSMQSMPLLSPLHPGAFNPMTLGGIYGVVGMAAPAPLPANPTWNGEPCPVHGVGLHHHHSMSMNPYQAAGYPPMYSTMSMRRAASVHELAMATPLPALMPPPPPPSAIYGTLPGHHHPPPQFILQAPPPPPPEPQHFMMMTGPPSMIAPPPASSIGGRMMRHPPHHHLRSGPASLPPPSLLIGPSVMQQHRAPGGRPIVVNGKNGQPEPLPVREAPPLPPKIPPSDVASRAASKSSSAKPFSYRACCQGNVVVLWVILGIIGLGVVLAVVFYYAFK